MAEILVCDDEPTIVEFVSALLTDEGHVVTGLSDPKLVAARVDSRPYDLVVLDFNMPGMDGKAVLTEIRKKYSPVELPAAFLTGISEKNTIQDLIGLGISAFILKPLDVQTFIGKVTPVLPKRLTKEQIPVILKSCNVPDPKLIKEAGINGDPKRQNAMYRVQLEGRSLVVSLFGTKSPKQILALDPSAFPKEFQIFAQFSKRWHRLWPTTWELEAGSKPKGQYDDLLSSLK